MAVAQILADWGVRIGALSIAARPWPPNYDLA
jgi:hypothetical protein